MGDKIVPIKFDRISTEKTERYRMYDDYENIKKQIFFETELIVLLGSDHFNDDAYGIKLEYDDLFLVLFHDSSDRSVNLFPLWNKLSKDGGAVFSTLNIIHETRLRTRILSLDIFHPLYWLKKDFNVPMVVVYRNGWPTYSFWDFKNLEPFIKKVVEHAGIVKIYKSGFLEEEPLKQEQQEEKTYRNLLD